MSGKIVAVLPAFNTDTQCGYREFAAHAVVSSGGEDKKRDGDGGRGEQEFDF